MTWTYFLLILVNTLLLVTGQFLWKYGLEQRDIQFSSIQSILRMLLSPYILAGLTLYGVATILWLFILTKVQLSVAYPFQSLAYLFAIIGAYFFFGESITLMKVLGVLIIIIGVSILGFSSSEPL